MPEIQTQTQLENEPACDFCLSRCENGGNSIEPIIFFSNNFGEEPRCCDDCNVEYVIPTRLELQRKDDNFCHRCCGITEEWKPVVCIYCRKLTSFCDDCSEKLDDFGTFSKVDDDDDYRPCGEPQSEFEDDEESSDEEPEESDDENN